MAIEPSHVEDGVTAAFAGSFGGLEEDRLSAGSGCFGGLEEDRLRTNSGGNSSSVELRSTSPSRASREGGRPRRFFAGRSAMTDRAAFADKPAKGPCLAKETELLATAAVVVLVVVRRVA